MDSRITIERVWLTEAGRCINYQYRAAGKAARYFDRCPDFYARYDSDLSSVPNSLLLIPLVANLAPIAWFAGFELLLPEIDKDFHEALFDLHQAFKVHYPDIHSSDLIKSVLKVHNTVAENGTALLFSGGLDSFESLTRNIALNPALISVFGADIELNDTLRWAEFKRFNADQPCVNLECSNSIESNLRGFYTAEVDLLVGLGWWGKVQHGMGLLGLAAPLSFLRGFNRLLIASSNTGEVSFGWGSTAATDEKMRWGGLSVVHDGYHLRRTEKVENIIRFAQETGENIKLRVCYAEQRVGYNCNRCAKCQRTMLAFILENVNPDQYGFAVPSDFYQLILDNFRLSGPRMSVGVKYEWQCLQDKARRISLSHPVVDLEAERHFLEIFNGLDIDRLVDVARHDLTFQERLKFMITRKFPNLFRRYLRLRMR